MGVGDHISSAAGSVNQYTVTAVKALGSAAISHVDKVVASEPIQKFNSYLQDEETRFKIYQVATNCTKNAAIFACREGAKSIPAGGPIVDIITRSVIDANKVQKIQKEEENTLRAELKDHKEKMKEMQSKMDRMDEELNRFRMSSNQSEVHEINAGLNTRKYDPNMNKKLDDQAVKTLIGNMGFHFLDGMNSDMNKLFVAKVFPHSNVFNGFKTEN